jgi:hypothetical protein
LPHHVRRASLAIGRNDANDPEFRNRESTPAVAAIAAASTISDTWNASRSA